MEIAQRNFLKDQLESAIKNGASTEKIIKLRQLYLEAEERVAIIEEEIRQSNAESDEPIVDNLIDPLKAAVPGSRLTVEELKEIIRESNRIQRDLTPTVGSLSPEAIEDIFERSLSIASSDTPGPSRFPPLTRVTPRRRGDSVYKPRRPFVGGAMKDGPLTSRRQSPHVRFREAIPAPRPSLIQPPSVRRSAPKPSPRSSPIQPPAARGSISKPAPGSPRKLSPPDRRRENRQQRNGFGLRVQFRVNFAPVKTASRPGGTSDEAPPPRPTVRITGASRGGGGSGALGLAA
ncbi:MAG: hypothetical protein IID54_07805 [Proteobacteria bacterium]|nr:hypothetical protein [Pseudomonadota bacterium]